MTSLAFHDYASQMIYNFALQQEKLLICPKSSYTIFSNQKSKISWLHNNLMLILLLSILKTLVGKIPCVLYVSTEMVAHGAMSCDCG